MHVIGIWQKSNRERKTKGKQLLKFGRQGRRFRKSRSENPINLNKSWAFPRNKVLQLSQSTILNNILFVLWQYRIFWICAFYCTLFPLMFHKNWQASPLIHESVFPFVCQLRFWIKFKWNLSARLVRKSHARSLSVNIFHQFPTYRYVELCRNGFSYWAHILSGKSRKTGNRKETTMERNLFFFFIKCHILEIFWICHTIKRLSNVSFCNSQDLLKFKVEATRS